MVAVGEEGGERGVSGEVFESVVEDGGKTEEGICVSEEKRDGALERGTGEEGGEGGVGKGGSGGG